MLSWILFSGALRVHLLSSILLSCLVFSSPPVLSICYLDGQDTTLRFCPFSGWGERKGEITKTLRNELPRISLLLVDLFLERVAILGAHKWRERERHTHTHRHTEMDRLRILQFTMPFDIYYSLYLCCKKFLDGKSLNKCFKNLKSDVFLGCGVTELCHFDTSRLKQLGKHSCSVFFCQLFDIEGLGKKY